MYPTEPARELSQYFVSDPELIPKIKTALRMVNGGPQDPSLNPLTGKPPVWRIPILATPRISANTTTKLLLGRCQNYFGTNLVMEQRSFTLENRKTK